MFLDGVSRLLDRVGGPKVAGAAVALAMTLAASPDAHAQVLSRFALRLEGGAGTMLSEYQRNSDPTQFFGNAKGFGLDIQVTGRLAITLADPLVLQLSAASWFFPSDTGNTGQVFAPMGGLRLEPRIGSVGRIFLDGNVGAALTGDFTRLTFDVGVGFEFQLARWFHVGPVVRYAHVIQPDEDASGNAEPFPEDARYWSAGLSIALRVPADEAAPPPPTDTDGDGVLDPEDACPTQPMGAHPDPTRRGCPATDMDQDTVFDPEDQCPNDPMGANPDPARRGCPLADSDGDGVLDPEDQCPNQPQGPTPDPARRGCPAGDRDNDTVLDPEDQCPDQPQGPTPDPNRRGCPISDQDHDGIPDDRDRCVDRPENFNGVEDEDGCPDRGRELAQLGEGQVRILQQINFRTDSDQIVGRRSFQILDAVATILRLHPEIPGIDVQGHTDDRGSVDHNRELSQRRAEAVRRALVERNVPENRLSAHGFGPDRPLVQGTSRRARAANRRVEFRIEVRPNMENVPPAQPAQPAPAPPGATVPMPTP